MAHKVKIGGTNYEVTGGRTLIGATGYDISGGKPKVSSANYSIEVGTPIAITITGSPSGSYGLAGYGGVDWISSINGSTMTTGTIYVRKGSTVSVTLDVSQGSGYFAQSISYIHYNNSIVATGVATEPVSLTYSFTADGSAIQINVAYSQGLNMTITQTGV